MEEKITMLSVEALKPHPKNEEFFDNADGEAFEKLKDSIVHLGVLTPLRVASDMTIISGHQRWRACKDLGIKQVPVIIASDLMDEEDKEMQLIASNFGRMKNDPVKQGKLIAEYERLAGVRVGRPGKLPNNSAISQKDIAKQLGVSVDTLANLKKLANLDPSVQELISEGKLTPTTGFKLISQLTKDEQLKLITSLDITQKYTQAAIESKIAQIRDVDLEYEREAERATKAKEEMQSKYEATQTQVASLLKRCGELEKEKMEIEAQKQEIEDSSNPADVEQIKTLTAHLETMNKVKGELEQQLRNASAQAEEMKRDAVNKVKAEYEQKIRELMGGATVEEKEEERKANVLKPLLASTPGKTIDRKPKAQGSLAVRDEAHADDLYFKLLDLWKNLQDGFNYCKENGLLGYEFADTVERDTLRIAAVELRDAATELVENIDYFKGMKK